MRFFGSLHQKLTPQCHPEAKPKDLSTMQKMIKLYSKLKPLFSNKKFLIVSLLASFGLLLPKISQAGGILGAGKVLGGLLYIYIQFMYNLTANVIAPILGWAVKGTNGFLQNEVVTEGWSVVRDTANMFFILILLFIAFATILRLEAYTYKRMLVPMIIAILLVNFSRTICGIIVEFSDTLMKGFIGGLTGGGGAEDIPKALLHGANLDTLLTVSEDAITKLKTIWSDVTNLMFIAAYMTVFTISLIAVSIFLIVRILALAFLTIVSPLVFAFQIIPAAKTFTGKWWPSFIKYALYGPVAVFCIMLAAKLSSSVLEIQTDPNKTGFLTVASTPTKTLQGLFVIGILFASVLAAKELGVAGAGAIISGAKGALAFAPGKLKEGIGAYVARGGLAKTAVGAAKFARHPGIQTKEAWKKAQKALPKKGVDVKKWWRETPFEEKAAKFAKPLSYLAPRTWKGAWGIRQQRAMGAEAEITGGAADILNRVMGHEKTDYTRQMQGARVAQYEKELHEANKGDSSEYLVAQLIGALEGNNMNKAEAANNLLVKTGNFNEALRNEKLGIKVEDIDKMSDDMCRTYFGKEKDEVTEGMEKVGGVTIDGRGGREAWLDKNFGSKRGANMSMAHGEMLKGVGDYSLKHSRHYDAGTDSYKLRSYDDWSKASGEEQTKEHPQNEMRKMARYTVADRTHDATGKEVGWKLTGNFKERMKLGFSKGALDRASQTPDKTKKIFEEMKPELRGFVKKLSGDIKTSTKNFLKAQGVTI